MRLDSGVTSKRVRRSVSIASGGNESLCGPGSTRTRAPPCGRRSGAPAACGPAGAGAAHGQPVAGAQPSSVPAAQTARQVGGAAAQAHRNVEAAVEREIRARTRAAGAKADHRSRTVLDSSPARQRPPVDRRVEVGPRDRHRTGMREARLEAAERGLQGRGSRRIADRARWRGAMRPGPSRRSRARPRADGPIARRPARSSSARPEARARLGEPHSPRRARPVMPTRCRRSPANRPAPARTGRGRQAPAATPACARDRTAGWWCGRRSASRPATPADTRRSAARQCPPTLAGHAAAAMRGAAPQSPGPLHPGTRIRAGSPP